MKNLIPIALISVLFAACNNTSEPAETTETEAATAVTTSEPAIFASYVDDSYANRGQGNDWVGVTVTKAGDNSINVSVRSRADKKRPTCTFDATAFKKDDSTYQAVAQGKNILFTFGASILKIAPENDADEGALYFFCSGGATVAGTYTKINESLDASQVDKTSFSKVLNLQGIGFNISSIEANGTNTLTVLPFGLSQVNREESIPIAGETVTGAEVEDLDADGSPDLVVYTQSTGNDKKGKVYAFSVNGLKSMSMVSFPETAGNSKINTGYRGSDEFALVENRLVQRFPVYKDGDADGSPTGGTRQVSYKLVKGEAMKKFEVDKVSE